MEAWEWRHGCGDMAVETWLWRHGCGDMAIIKDTCLVALSRGLASSPCLVALYHRRASSPRLRAAGGHGHVLALVDRFLVSEHAPPGFYPRL
jgi:hypothetical protein